MSRGIAVPASKERGRRRVPFDPVGAVCAALTAISAAVISSVVFGRIPHVQDSITQLFQARIFALGRLWMPSAPFRAFFDYTHMINDGRWYCQYPPGHSFLLVPAVWLGAPWLVNPILGGLAVYGIFLLGREAFGVAAGRLAAILGLLSPFLLLMASEFMAHVSCLAAITWFLVFLLRAARSGRASDGRLAGVFLLLAVLIRPYTAFALAAPSFAYALWSLRAGPFRSRIGPLLWTAAGGGLGVVLLGLYQWGTTGSPIVPGYVALYGPSHGVGFGKGSWGPPHTLLRGLHHAWGNLRALNFRLFEWPASSLWPLALAVLPGRDRSPGSGATTGFLLALPLSLLAAYVFYWYSDLCFGPRYLYEALGPILVLSAAGLLRAGGWLARLLRRGDGGATRAPLGLLLLALFAAAFAAGWPALFRAPREAVDAAAGSVPRMASYFQRYSKQYWGVGPFLGELVERRVEGRAVVFVRFQEPEIDLPATRYLWFGSAFARMEPDFRRARVVYARDQGELNASLLASMPDRAAYLYTGTIESGSLALLRGPVPR